MRYADPVAQAEIDRLRAKLTQDRCCGHARCPGGSLCCCQEEQEAVAVLDRLRACSDPTPPAEGQRHTAEQLWHHLLEASSHRRLYVLNQFLESQDDALRCFLEGHEQIIGGLERQLRDYSDDVNNAYRRGVLDGRAGHKLTGES